MSVSLVLSLQDQRIVHAMIHRWSEEEQRAVLGEEEAWRWHLQQREEEREKQERQLQHQRELQQSKQRFQKQVYTEMSAIPLLLYQV